MRRRRQEKITAARKAGYIVAGGITEMAELFESRYKRQAFLEAVNEIISRRLARMKKKGSRSS